MRHFSSSLISIFALAFIAPAAALAADYEPPLVVDQAPEYVPVEVGSGWYLRGDVGYDVETNLKDVDYGAGVVSGTDKENGFSGSLGFGYHFTDYLRADLNIGYLPGNEISFGTATGNTNIENSALYGMANAYVDLGTYAGLTPYIGAGAGIFRSERRFGGSDVVTGDFRDNANQYSFAYTLNAGLAYRVTKNLALDVGYQYLSAPSAQYQTPTGVEDGLHFHQVRAGLRYDLW